jgi:hypothetical protein
MSSYFGACIELSWWMRVCPPTAELRNCILNCPLQDVDWNSEMHNYTRNLAPGGALHSLISSSESAAICNAPRLLIFRTRANTPSGFAEHSRASCLLLCAHREVKYPSEGADDSSRRLHVCSHPHTHTSSTLFPGAAGSRRA